jgi:methyl-accepting chemotaxis protein
VAKTVTQELLVKFVGDTKELQQAANRAQDSIKSVSGAASIASTALKTFAGAISISAIASAARSTMQWADDLGDLSITLGVTTEKVQALQYAAIANGSSVNEVNSAMLRFTNAVGEAATAGGPLLDRFNELNISIFDANGQVLDLSELLPNVANAIANASTAQEKLNIATDFFGRSAAPSMVRLLGEGADKLTELEQAARDAGVVLDEEMIKKAAEINGQWEILTHTIGTKFKAALITGIDYMSQLKDAAIDTADYLNHTMFGVDRGKYAQPEIYAQPLEPEVYAEPIGYGTSGSPSKVKPSRGKAGSAVQQIKAAAESAAPSIERLNYTINRVNDSGEQMGDTFNNTFGDLTRAVAGSQNAFDSLRNVALRALGDIGNSLINMATGGGSGGGLGGLIAGGIGRIFGGVTATSGPAAGQTVFPSFDVGSQYVPRDMLAQVHRGEMIVPAAKAASMRAGESGITVVQNNTFGNGVSRGELAAMLPAFKRASVEAVMDAQKRGAV